MSKTDFAVRLRSYPRSANCWACFSVSWGAPPQLWRCAAAPYVRSNTGKNGPLKSAVPLLGAAVVEALVVAQHVGGCAELREEWKDCCNILHDDMILSAISETHRSLSVVVLLLRVVTPATQPTLSNKAPPTKHKARRGLT